MVNLDRQVKIVLATLPSITTFNLLSIPNEILRLHVRDKLILDLWREREPNMYQRCAIVRTEETYVIQEINRKPVLFKRVDRIFNWLDGNRRCIDEGSWCETQLERMSEFEKYKTAKIALRIMVLKQEKKRVK